MTLPLGSFKRFGIMGGSFNPPHVGHLSIAQQILNALKLERVFLMPAAVQPLKQASPDMAPADDRLEMCRISVRNMHGLDVSSYELDRGGVSYTIETARELRKAYGPDVEMRFIIGSDSLKDLPMWRDAAELVKLADFAIASRREAPLADDLWAHLREELGEEAEKKLRASVVPIQHVDVSSTQIRTMLRMGQKIPGYLRKSVEAYVRKNKLYL